MPGLHRKSDYIADKGFSSLASGKLNSEMVEFTISLYFIKQQKKAITSKNNFGITPTTDNSKQYNIQKSGTNITINGPVIQQPINRQIAQKPNQMSQISIPETGQPTAVETSQSADQAKPIIQPPSIPNI